MIELKNKQLKFSFPEIHEEAEMTVEFQRTFRIPDDGRDYPLPPGFGNFPMHHVDDFAEEVPEKWRRHGGVMLPMYQSEALWIYFDSPWIHKRDTSYPFAVQIAAGKINAVTGHRWNNRLVAWPQSYLVIPEQPWLDGFCVERGFIRQFVAMPLGSGYSAEEQLTGKADHGGLQIKVFPMKREVFQRRFPEVEQRYEYEECLLKLESKSMTSADAGEMGLAPGGRMRQQIYKDPYGYSDWDSSVSSRCFVHITNSLTWRQITGYDPPTVPPTAKEYVEAGLPWFDYYDERLTAVKGGKKLEKIKSINELAKEKGDVPLPENQTVKPGEIIKIDGKLKTHQVREGDF